MGTRRLNELIKVILRELGWTEQELEDELGWTSPATLSPEEASQCIDDLIEKKKEKQRGD